MLNMWDVKYGAILTTSVITVLLLQATFTCANETTCNMKAVSRGETATMECFFGENMATSHHEIFVQRKVGDSSKPDHVMDCFWQNDSYTCAPTSPFVFDGNISDSLTLDLPNAQTRDEGNYFCEVLEETFSYKSCKFDTLLAIENEYAAVKEDAGLGETSGANSSLGASTEEHEYAAVKEDARLGETSGANSSLGASTEEVTTNKFQAKKSEFKENNASSSLKSNTIIGISVGATAAVLALVTVCVILYVRHKKRRGRKSYLPRRDKGDHLDGSADGENAKLQAL